MAPAKSSKSPAFQFYPKDFFSSRKVDAMSMTERGIYITLLGRCWDEDGLPTDIPELARIVRMKPAQFSRLWQGSSVRLCFFERGGKLHNERLDRERKVQVEYRKKQKEKADKRWESRGNAAAMPDAGTRHEPGNAPLPRSLPQSADRSSQSATKVGPAPIHSTHKAHAFCGRVCVPAFLHTQFVQRRNSPDASMELGDFYVQTNQVWCDGPHAKDEPGEGVKFWEARYAERWPASKPANVTTAWKPRGMA